MSAPKITPVFDYGQKVKFTKILSFGPSDPGIHPGSVIKQTLTKKIETGQQVHFSNGIKTGNILQIVVTGDSDLILSIGTSVYLLQKEK